MSPPRLQMGIHPGSGRALALLDRFEVQGPNGEHDVLALQVIGPHLGDMFKDDPDVIQTGIKSLAPNRALSLFPPLLRDSSSRMVDRSIMIDPLLTGVISTCTKRHRVQETRSRRKTQGERGQVPALAGMRTGGRYRPPASDRVTSLPNYLVLSMNPRFERRFVALVSIVSPNAKLPGSESIVRSTAV